MSELQQAQRASEEARTRLHNATKAYRAASAVYRAANTEWDAASNAAQRAGEVLARLISGGAA